MASGLLGTPPALTRCVAAVIELSPTIMHIEAIRWNSKQMSFLESPFYLRAFEIQSASGRSDSPPSWTDYVLDRAVY